MSKIPEDFLAEWVDNVAAMTAEEIAKRLFEHPAFNTGGAGSFETNAARGDWVAAAQRGLDAMATASSISFRGRSPASDDLTELFARMLYEYPGWGYKRPWQRGRADCARYYTAARDVLPA